MNGDTALAERQVACPRCGATLVVYGTAQVWHNLCPSKGPRELAPEYREVKA